MRESSLYRENERKRKFKATLGSVHVFRVQKNGMRFRNREPMNSPPLLSFFFFPPSCIYSVEGGIKNPLGSESQFEKDALGETKNKRKRAMMTGSWSLHLSPY
jgi:hypothetical protein